jgi:predicted ATPase
VVAEAIANALTLQEAGQIAIENVLKIYLREKHILLVLDNFEQVIDAAPLIGELLSVAQTLHVMVTSRQALQIYGEHEFVVQPLSLPDLESQSLLDDLAKSEACTLFVQRARAAKSNFEVTDENAAAIAKICVKLDGLPLAIELAAAQIKIFSPQTMLPRLEDSLNVLKTELRDLPKRHASLNQAISWSYNLLSETEQRLLARLSVFIAGRSIEAAEVVCGEKLNIDVLDGLSSLLNKGLLRLEEDRTGEPRFFMLETIHAYARERLQERGEVDHMQRLHAEFFTDWVEYAEPYTAAGGRQLYWLHRLETEHDNLRAALTWSFDGGDYEIGQRMVGALAHFWERRGHHREWKEWLARAWVGIEEVPKPIRASLVQSAGYLAYNRHEYPEAIQHLKKAERLFRELDDKNKCALMKIKHSVLLAARPEAYQEAIQLIETAFALLRETGNEPLYCQGLNALGNVEHRNGNFEDARKIFEETLALARGIGDQLRECLMQENLGDVHCHIGNYDQAELFIKESLKVGKEIDFKYVVADSLRIFSGISAGRGEVKRAAQLLGATVAAFEEIGIRLQPQDQPEFDRQVANIHDKLGTETFDDMWARGRAMTLDNALEFAIANSSAE